MNTPIDPPTGQQVLQMIFALCENTEEKMPPPDAFGDVASFERGRAFEAKSIRKAMGTWFQDEFCGRSFMGEPVQKPID